MKKTTYSLAFMLLYNIVCCFSQQKDAHLWLGVDLEKSITKKIGLNIEEQIRFENNYNSVKTVFTELGISYELNDLIKINNSYRFSKNPDYGLSATTRHRYMLDLNLKYKNKPFILYIRNRFQSDFGKYTSENSSPYQSLYDRLKFNTKFDLDKKIEPYIGCEVFYPLNHPYIQGMDRYRLFTGIDYKVNKTNSLKGFFIFQRDRNVESPNTIGIIGISYSLNLDELSFFD